jgi:DNA-binding NarL/FixJ family response regulator
MKSAPRDEKIAPAVAFDVDVVGEALQLDSTTVLALMQELIDAGLAVEEMARRVAFRHALARLMAAAELLAGERQAARAAVAEALARRGAPMAAPGDRALGRFPRAVDAGQASAHRPPASRLTRLDGRKPDRGAAAVAGLTKREAAVAGLLARGHTNRMIAAELAVSERTIEGHVSNILAKLEFTSRAQAAVWAAERGLAPPSEALTA